MYASDNYRKRKHIYKSKAAKKHYCANTLLISLQS